MTTPVTDLVQVTVGVVINDRKVLIAKRQKGQHLEGFWEFPGGKIERAETPVSALVRELKEEVGLEIYADDVHFIRTECYHYPSKSVELHFHWVTPKGEVIASGQEGQNIAWVGADDLADYTFPDANQALLADVLHKLAE